MTYRVNYRDVNDDVFMIYVEAKSIDDACDIAARKLGNVRITWIEEVKNETD